MSIAAILQHHDPNRIARRRALRATIVVPALFGVASAAGSDVVALYVLFSAFSHLVFGDYGGRARQRARAYLATTAIGLVLILIGTAVSQQALVAAMATAVVSFAITLLCALGPAVPPLRTPLLLAFVLAASVAAPLGDVGPRLVGWGWGGVASVVAAFMLFPRRGAAAVSERAADACTRLADAMLAPPTDRPPVEPAALQAAHSAAAAAALGPTARRQALVALVEQLQAFERFLAELPVGVTGDRAAHQRLAEATAETLRTCAAPLRRAGPAPEVEPLDRARAEHRAALETWAEDQLRAGRPAAEVLAALDGERMLRLLSNVGLGIATATRVVCGAPLPERWLDRAPAVHLSGTLPQRAARILRPHLALSSVRFRDALRAGAAFGGAVLVAGLFDFEHGFWVVLGTLNVLRTSVLAGGRTAVAAVGGTVVGFLAVVPIVWLAGTATAVQWILLVPCAFVAAFAAGVLPYAVGQAAFTIFVVVAVNIVQPNGWHTGAIRVIDVLVGAAVALVAGLLFWPRGAREQARATLAALYGTLARLVAAAFAHTFGAPATDADVAQDEPAALARARAAIMDLAAERGQAGHGVAASTRLTVAGVTIQTAAERITNLPPTASAPPAPLSDDVDRVVGSLRRIADALEAGQSIGPDLDPVRIDAERRDVTAARRASGALSPQPAERADAFTLVWASQWLVDLARIADDLRSPVDELATIT